MKLQKSNRFDNLLVLFISLQSLGIIGGALQPIRIFIFACIPSMITYFITHKTNLKHFRYELIFFIFWIFYALLSLGWAIIPQDSLKEVMYLIVNFIAIFVFYYLSLNANNPYNSIIKGWITLFLITLPVALYEIIYDVHLPISYQESESMMNFGFEAIIRNFASVTFGNLNGYNLMLTYTLPFVTSLFFIKGNKISVILKFVIFLFLIYLVFSNSSRAAFMCLIISVLVLSFYILKNRKMIIVYSAFIVGAIVSILYFFADNLTVLFLRFGTQGLEDTGRSDLIKYGFDALLNSYFLGIGAGNFMPTMSQVYKLDLTASHNFLLEIIVPYGLMVFVFFLGWLIRIFKNQQTNPNKISKYIIICSLLCFPITSIINSGYILNVWVWMFLASLVVISDKYFIKYD